MIKTEELNEALKWRYAVKKFDTKPIPPAIWKTLEDSLVLTPSSYGLQPWKFLIVENKEIREKLVPVSWNQRQIADASHLVVFAVKEKVDEALVQSYVEQIAKVRNIDVSTLDGYKNMMIGDVVKGPRSAWSFEWAARQAYIAAGSLSTASALLGVDTCIMEGFDPGQYDEILGLKGTGWKSVVVMTVGYRADDDGYAKLKKVRFDHDTVVKRI